MPSPSASAPTRTCSSPTCHKGGILYASFKYGESDFYLGKRWYTNMTEERLTKLATTGGLFEIEKLGSFGNEHPDQPDFRFLYVVLRSR